MTQRDSEGPLGRSRIERVHLRWTVDAASLEPFDLVRIVDADNDPELAEMALEGTLHRLPDGTDLAEPFVYHARSAETLVLVVPPAARHLEMAARHELLNELEALDTVPAYAFDFRVVVEPTELRTALSYPRSSLAPPLIQDVSDDEVDEVDEANEPDEFEDDSAPDEEDQADQESHTGGNAELAELAEFSPELSRELSSYLITDGEELEAVSAEEVESLAPESGVEAVEHDVVEDVEEDREDDGEDVEDDDGDSAEGSADDVATALSAVRNESAGEFELVDAEWVTPYESEDEDELLTPGDDDLVTVPESYSTLLELPSELPNGVAPPADFEHDPRRLRAGLFKDSVWLFARTHSGAFESDAIDAAVQYVKSEGRAVALFTLADLAADHSDIVRLATDLGAAAPRTLLGALAKNFVVSVAFFHAGATPVRCVQLRSARETNVALLLTLPTAPDAHAADVSAALARVLATPPPFDSNEHPFQMRSTSTLPVELRAQVRSVARWLEPTRLDRVRLGLGVPESVIFHVCQTMVEAALATGVALPPVLMQWATAAGLAETPAGIVATQLEAFLALTSEPDQGGLRDTDVVSNWKALRSVASALAVTIPPAVAEVFATLDSDDVSYDSAALESLDVPALLELASHPNHRGAATTELLRRDPTLHAESVGRSLRDMRREEVVALVPALVRAGDSVVPTLLDTLSARKTYVRQAAALTLASLHAEVAVPELIKLVASESTTLWEEFARALAAFGELAEAAVVAALKSDLMPPDRAALVFAYLAKAGLGSSLDELARSSDARVAAVAVSVTPQIATVERHLREFYDASMAPTGPREFGKKLFRALHPDSSP